MDFSLPVTVPDEEMADGVPSLSVVVGSTSTARTTTYLTRAALYTAEGLLGGNGSVWYGGSYSNGTSMFFRYLVAADDSSVDLRCVNIFTSAPARLVLIRRIKDETCDN